METVVERPAALDVHKEQVTACVRVPGPRGAGASSTWRSSRRRSRGCWRCATGWRRTGSRRSRWRRPACTGSRCGRSSRTSSSCCWSTPATSSRSPAARPTCPGCGVAVPARRGRAVARELRAAQADPGAAEPDPVSQDADPGARPGGQPAAQGAGGHRDQARLRRDRHPRQVRAGDARRARGRAPPTPRCSPSSPRASCARRSPRCKEALEGRFDHLHAVWIGAILAHLDFLDEQIASADRRDRGADRPFREGR